MKVDKKVSMGVGWARKKAYEYKGEKFVADLKDGDVITILNEGMKQMNNYGNEQSVFKIKTRNGEKALAFNQKSINNLIDVFGNDTNNWIDKQVKAWLIKALVSGEMKTVIYLADPSWEMDDEGNFSASGEGQPVDDLDEIDFEEEK